MEWLNKGVAPAYADYMLVLRLEGKSGSRDIPIESGNRAWMPDEPVKEEYPFSVPQDVKEGSYTLKFKLVDPSSDSRTVLVGVGESMEDEKGFIEIGKVKIAL